MSTQKSRRARKGLTSHRYRTVIRAIYIGVLYATNREAILVRNSLFLNTGCGITCIIAIHCIAVTNSINIRKGTHRDWSEAQLIGSSKYKNLKLRKEEK